MHSNLITLDYQNACVMQLCNLIAYYSISASLAATEQSIAKYEFMKMEGNLLYFVCLLVALKAHFV